MLFRKKAKLEAEKNYLSYELNKKNNHKHDVYCALCGTQRNALVGSPALSGTQHAQVVLASVFIAWALFPLVGAISFFLYPFVWMFTDLAKKSIYRKGAQCNHCGFDAITYSRDVTKAKALVKNHMDLIPHKVIFKRGYGRKPKESQNKAELP